MCTRMVGSAIMNNKDLGRELSPPLIDQWMKIYQDEGVEFKNAAKVVTQTMTQLDEVQEELEEQAQRKDLRKGARKGTVDRRTAFGSTDFRRTSRT